MHVLFVSLEIIYDSRQGRKHFKSILGSMNSSNNERQQKDISEGISKSVTSLNVLQSDVRMNTRRRWEEVLVPITPKLYFFSKIYIVSLINAYTYLFEVFFIMTN